VQARRSRRLILLDHVAQRFEPGVRYPESAINRELRNLHEDYAALRRYLIDEGFLERRDGMYWRAAPWRASGHDRMRRNTRGNGSYQPLLTSRM